MSEAPVYFLATNPQLIRIAALRHRYVLVAVNEMMAGAAAERGEQLIVDMVAADRSVFVDSGVFWLTNEHKRRHGITMDQALSLPPDRIDGFDDLFKRYVEVCSRHGDDVWGYIELDQGGRENKRRTRTRLEDLGLSPIPVYHPLNDGRDYLDELMETYDRICFGNIVQADRPTRARLLHMMWDAKVRHPDVWVHVLGLTPSEMSLAFPSDSADSSSWLTGLRWHKAEREKSMLKTISNFPRNHAYDQGDDDSRNSAVAAALTSYQALAYTWRQVLADRLELGLAPHDFGPIHTPGAS